MSLGQPCELRCETAHKLNRAALPTLLTHCVSCTPRIIADEYIAECLIRNRRAENVEDRRMNAERRLDATRIDYLFD